MARRAPRGQARAGRTPAPAPARASIRRKPARLWLLGTTALLPVAAGPALAQPAPGQGPTGGQVVAGQAGIARTPGRTTVTQSTNRAAIDWQQFNVGSQHTVQFVQPSQGSWTLNRVVGPDPSVIAGRVQANGGVAIVNQSGMVFAQGAQVDVGSLIASAAGITNENFMAGRMAFDQAPRRGARVENHGSITVADRGLAALVGPNVSNSGVIRARLGRVALGAAETFVLDLAGDGLIGIDVTQAVREAPQGGAALVTNSGTIEAPGGSVLLTAHAASDLVEDLVRQTGRISAPTADGRAGQVVLRAEGGSVRVEGTIDATGGAGARGGAVAIQATEGVTVAAGATVDASGAAGGGRVLVGTAGRGRQQPMARRTTVEAGATIRADATTAGNGGEIVVNSADRTEMRGTLTARGGATSGNGGFIEVSGQGAFVLQGIVDLTAGNGALGDFLLDPQNIIISSSGTPTVPFGTVTDPSGTIGAGGTFSAATGNANDWVRIDAAALAGFAAGNVTLEANRQIIVDSTVNRTNAGNVTLRAGVGTGVTDGNIVQRAGADFSVNGTLTLETNQGAISLAANVRATAVVLSASGDIAQTGGNIQHRTSATTQLPLSAISSAGNVTLAQSGNGNFALGASGATAGTFTVSANTLRVGSSLTANATSLTAATGTLTLAGDIRATSLALSGATGVTQSGGTIAHRDSTPATPVELPLTANTTSGPVTLDQTGNGPVELRASTAAGDFTLTAEAIRTTGALTANVATLTAETGAIELGANVRATDLNLVAQTGISQSAGTIAHRSGANTPIDLAASLAAAGNITLGQANGEINLLTGGTFAGNFTLAATGDTTLAAGQTLSVAGEARITLTGTADLALNGTLQANSAVLQAQGDITQATTAVLAPLSAAPGAALDLTVAVTGNNNSVDLLGANGVIRLVGGSTQGEAFALRGTSLSVAGPLSTADGATRGNVTLVASGTTGSIALGGAVTAAGATLRANGAVTQSAALDLGGTLTIRGQDGTPTSGAGSVALTLANQVTTLDARATGALAFTSGAAALSITQARGNGVAITGTGVAVAVGGGASGVVGTGTGAISVVANSLTLSGGIAQLGGGSISLRTDAITTGGIISAPSATVEIGPRTAGRGVLVGGATDATRLRITETALNAVTAGTVRLGSTTIGASTVTGGAVEIAGAVSLPATTTFEVAAGGDITLGAAVEAGRVRLGATGNIALGTFDVTSDGASGGIELRAGGTITQGTGSEIIASGATRELVAQAGAGSLSLTGTGSFRVADGGAEPRGLLAPGDITVNLGTSGALTIAGAVQAGGTANLTARSIALQAALTAPTAVNLAASGGGAASTITQTASGTISTALLTANATGAVSLSAAPNQVANLGTFSFNDAFRFRTNAAVTVSGAIAPTTVGSNADITLIASSVDVNAALAAGTGTVTLQATGGNVSQTATGTITAGRLEASASGSVLLDTAPNAVGTFGAGGAGGTFALRNGRPLTIDSALTQGAGGGILRLTTDGTLTVANGGSIAFSDITLAAASGMTISGNIGQAGATVRLGAGGAITQTATGGITAGTLGIYAPGDIALTAGTNAAGAIGAFTPGAFGYRGSGTVQTTTVADVIRPFFNPLLPGGFIFGSETVSGIRAASVDITADSLRVRNATGGSALGEGVAATATTGLVRLRLDGLAIDADSAITAGANPTYGGSIDLATRTAGRNIVIGADQAGTLALGPGVLGRLYGETVTIGAAGAGAGTLTVAGPASSNAVNELALRGASIGIDGALSMFGTGRVSLTAATGDITQSATGSISAPNLVATATLGDVRLDVVGAANNIAPAFVGGLAVPGTGTVSGSAGGGDFAFRNAGNVSVAAPGITATGGTVTLVSTGGAISQAAAAPITTGTLVANALGTVTLDLGTNAVATLGAGSAGGAGFTFRTNRALTVAGVSSSSGGITLEAPGGMTLSGNVSAPNGRVVLRTGATFDTPGAGDITQTGGIIAAANLSASAGGDVALTRANEVQVLVAGLNADGLTFGTRSILAGGNVTFSNALSTLFVVSPVVAGTNRTATMLTNGLAVLLPGTAFLAPGGVVRFAPFTNGRTIDVGGVTAGATNLATGTLQQVSANRLVIGGTTGQGGTSGNIVFSAPVALPGVNALELQSGGAIVGNAQAITVNRVSAFATGDISLGGAAGSIGGVAAGSGRPEGIATDGSVSIVAGGTGTFAVDAAIQAGAGRTIALQAADFELGANVGTATGTPGRIELTGTQTVSLGGTGPIGATARLEAAELARLDAAGGTIRIAGPAIRLDGTWTLDPADAARLEMLLTTGGAGTIAQNAGTLSAGTLVIDARQTPGTVQIDRAGNAIGTLDAQTGGALSVATGGALSVQRADATAGNITLSGGSITLADTLGLAVPVVRAQAGNVALTATAGDITGTTPRAAVSGTALTANALAGEVRLTGNNSVGTFTATARDGVLFRNTGALTAGATGGAGAAVAGNVDIRGTALTLGDIRATGTVTLDATTGDILQSPGATLAAGTLSATATAGNIRLDGANLATGVANNAIQDLTALSAGGDITLRNGTALTIDLPLSVGTNRTLTLEAAGLTIAGNLSAAGPAGQIILRTGGFTGGANAGDITQQAGTAISAARLAALAGGTITLDQPGNAIGTLAGGRSAAGTALGLGLSAGGDATLRIGTGATLTVGEALQVGTGRTLTLRADDLAIAAQLRAPGGTIVLLPATANGTFGYVLGGAAGSVNAGRITLDSTELSFLPAVTPAATLSLGDVATTGAVTIAGTVDLVDGASPRVGLLSLAGIDGLTQNPGSVLDVAALRAIFTKGAVLLDPGNAGNRIAALEGVTAGGDVVVRGGAGLMTLRDGGAGTSVVAGTGARIVLRADDLDIQAALRAPGGTVNLLPESLGRTVTLGGTGAGTLALDAAEMARIGDGGPAAARLRIGSDGTLRSAGDIRIVGNVALRDGGGDRVGQLDLVAGGTGIAGGAVVQTGGVVDVATLTGTAQGDFGANGANRIDAFAGITAGRLAAGGTAPADVALRSTIDARIAGLDATRDLTVTGGGTLTATPVTIATDAGSATIAAALTAGRSATLTATGALAAGPVTAANITLQGASIDLTGRIGGNGANATSATLRAPGGSITQDPGAIIAANRLAVTGGTVTLTEANQVSEITGFAAGGAVGFTTVLPLLVSGAVSANGTLALTTSGTLTVSGAGSLAVAGGPGTASLSSGGAMNVAGRLTSSGDATLAARTGGLSFTGNGTVGGTARLTAPGAITLGGSLVAAGGVQATAGAGLSATGTLRAGGDVRLQAGGTLTHSGVTQAGLGLTFGSSSAMTLGGSMTAGTDVTLTAGGLATLANGKIGAPGTIALLSGGGLVMQSFAIDPAIIRLETAGPLTATGSTLVSSDSIRLAGGAVTLRDMNITTGTLDVESAGTMLVDGGTFTLGRAVLFSAPAGISAGDVITIRPLDSSQLPVVMFDTRIAGARPDPLSVVRPDIPGVPNAQQPMQVRLPGTEVPGVFGPASSAPAGLLAINVDAGRSPIFLLIDGGFVSGTIVSAGRLGIHGTGGGSELTGNLTDISGSPVSGSAAARFADSTRPAASGALSRYRFNGCVVSSVNCVVPSQVISIPQAPPQRVDITLGGGRITDPDVQIPNVAEEDY
ncbi:filamentous hemagglutinin N-terminal domain-containing protein [Roseomonas sp. PWR1]|uniref:Filamentous hemagglutinin N-terminal domain-containing protein n=1 Tax=Roseomonas nitratireducens TaxID=2820810 RepID=A0ABS4AW45_9PROT|nr:filamentous hemagglutinin N-terminal domain-containing protein [Neoroseomonas nitratireducens]MBP0465561.1 filamentous hemagglutinin N-terminal domain-containing protein [Neoroseomonas nitratireducens]